MTLAPWRQVRAPSNPRMGYRSVVTPQQWSLGRRGHFTYTIGHATCQHYGPGLAREGDPPSLPDRATLLDTSAQVLYNV